ncbi:AbrB/MazE/SpoVT family DNA-binding domain-containing protein [Mesorhizobium sp. ANAO-SY3R2]|uniref:AbrB/MazE/SpoVT family DNA-binding domain-containing protein n=1 Tax=Mesorhizobium sp. ANAO-SY3R2 TaxID=3166644 RepID=UPI00366D7379
MTAPEASKGFAEEAQKPYSSKVRDELLRKPPRFERLRVGDGGRIVIPAAMREEMGIKPGDDLVAHVEDGVLHIISFEENLRRIQDEVSKYKKPGESVVDEFLAERRAMWDEE